MKIKRIEIGEQMSVLDLVREMGASGVFCAGRLAKAVDIFVQMVSDPDVKVFLGLAGALVPAGLGGLFADLIREGFVDVIVSTGANITHDIIEAFGEHHERGVKGDDSELRKRGINRIYDAYVSDKAFIKFEERIQQIFKDINVEKRKNGISVCDLLNEIGKRLKDKNSFVKAAADEGVPIFCPAITDSILGLQAWLFSQLNPLKIDVLEDLHQIINIAYESKKSGAIFLGGGFPKNHILQTMLITGRGFDYAVQITLDRPESGGLSGAPLSEARSWGKLKSDANSIDLIADVTIAFPILAAAAKQRLKKDV
ncbi:deoxyhypusine synthase [Candidatus Jordarchaeum sp.]|uniref:deoxyhypusine synthase n=1 Tax=Candidatus Jordarchaeum sp. TaxID=2823881 RepID=UPI00404B1581